MTTHKKQEQDEKNSFPRMVYKKGTGRQVTDAGLYEASESTTAHDEKQLAELLRQGWVESPEAAAAGNKDPHGKPANITVKAEHAVIEQKKP